MDSDNSSNLLAKIATGTFVSGLVLAAFGIVLVVLGASGDTTFTFFGQSFRSTNVGIAAVFIGAALTVLNIRRVLKSHDIHHSPPQQGKNRNRRIPVTTTKQDDRGVQVNVVQVVGEQGAATKRDGMCVAPLHEVPTQPCVVETYDSDLPPFVEVWVGRDSEMSLCDGIESGVVAITGIGGQGKSSLAAKVLEARLQRQPSLFWDWRDCREEANRFRTHLVSVIERRTLGRVSATMLADANVEFLCKFLFKDLESDEALIVFDNVDHYADIDQSLFISDVSAFITEALRVEHRALVVFTCRPRISYASPRFREIYLRGLTAEESMKLFSLRNPGPVGAELEAILRRFHSLTDGHPLWLNIIASQIGRKHESAEVILKNLESGGIDDRANAMLRGVWHSLNDTQQHILRTMSELPRAMTAGAIFEYIAGSVPNRHRYDRAFRGLKAISLITGKGGLDSADPRYELHPMVTAFIRTEYGERGERNELLDALILSCGNIVLRLRARKSNVLSCEVLEQMTTQSELQLSRGNVTEAIKTLQDSADSLIARGLHEELFRLSEQVFQHTDWNTSEWVEDATFWSLLSNVTKAMVEQGRVCLIEPVLEAYTAATRTGTARFVDVCELNAYVNWFLGKHRLAIKWADRGIALKARGGIARAGNCDHTRALALRDSGRVKEALRVFLSGNAVSDILVEDHLKTKRGAHFYGNIGRCLYLDGDEDNALVLFAKSFDILNRNDDATSILNRGYAALWIGETLLTQDRKDEARQFLSLAVAIWKGRAPHKVDLPGELLEKCGGSVPEQGRAEATTREWCKEWTIDVLKKPV